MSKRLQVVLEEEEMSEIQQAARIEGTTVSEWVRRVLREARRKSMGPGLAERLDAVARACQHNFPAGPIEQVLAEIEQGYWAEQAE